MIHPTAVVDKDALIAEGVKIGPYAVIEKNVDLAEGVEIGPSVYIKGDVHIGENTFIGTGAVIGEMPQVSGVRQNAGKVRIGRNNILREYVTINSSSSCDSVTSIGDNNYFMSYAHLAHDCSVNNDVVICSGALIAGHVEVQDKAFVSGNVVVHQFVRIGRMAMVGGLSRVNQDIPPFMMLVGDSRIWGVNLIGLKRAQFSREEIKEIRNVFNLLYRKKLSVKNALSELDGSSGARTREIVDFIRMSKRGICGPNRSSFIEKLFLDYPYLLFLKIPTYRILSEIRGNNKRGG